MARRPTPTSRRRDLVHPKLPPTITLAVDATIAGDTVVLTAVEPMTYNPRMQRATSALPGLQYRDANGLHDPQMVTLSGDNTIATVDFGTPLQTPGTLTISITMQALRSFRGGQIIIGGHTFVPPFPTTALGFAGFTNGNLNGQGRWLTTPGDNPIAVTAEKAGILIGGPTEGQATADVSDLVTTALTLAYVLEWESPTLNTQHQLFLSDATRHPIWYVQMWRHFGNTLTDIILVTAAGTAAHVDLAMPANTPTAVELRATNNHCELWFDGSMLLSATLINGNQNAFGSVQLDAYAADTTNPAHYVSAMTITPAA